MCNQYNLTLVGGAMNNVAKGRLAKAHWDIGNAGPGKVFPKYQGIVARDDGGEIVCNAMTWGFPRILKSKRTGEPLKPVAVNNARSEKLDSPFWAASARNPANRCLIPVSAFAEAMGKKGQMTTTWLSLPDTPMFVCAGLWRESAEWGRCYTMVMCNNRPDLAYVHDRMPVILHPDNYENWLSAPLDDIMNLCEPWMGPITVDETDIKWGKS